ncbi:UNVERIFIED_ORG: hypothetical protein DFO51_104154 [Aeromonas veronii]
MTRQTPPHLLQARKTPCSVSKTTIIVLAGALAWGTAYSTTITVPIPSIRVTQNTCNVWHIEQTYTATPVDSSVLEQLNSYGAFSHLSHFHADVRPQFGDYWTTESVMQGTPQQKLAAINKKVFNTEYPTEWQQVTFRNSHGGACAQELGRRECVGIFVSPATGGFHSPEPTTFPLGVCSGVPPVGVSCSFDAGAASVDLGTGRPGSRYGEVDVSVSCSRAVDYRISVLGTWAGGGGISDIRVTANGNELPAVLHSTSGADNITLGVSAHVALIGHNSSNGILLLDLP